MHVKSIRLKGFKRFHDLTIGELSEKARLVVMTGPNGCGKSSLFDAFATWYGFHRESGLLEPVYHMKSGFSLSWDQAVNVVLHESVPTALDERKKMFYIRSAYRNEPDFTVKTFGSASPPLDDTKRVKRLIDNDVHVSANYQGLIGKTIASLYDSQYDNTTIKGVRDLLIGQVRRSMLKVFDDLMLTGPGNPMEDGTFRFDKGTSKDFLYKNLSGGEKATFDILLDFIVKRTLYDNTVYCIDEPELHMNTRVQGKLLDELYSLIPDTCQLWVSTHAVGMMRAAKRLKDQHAEQVVFLDFDHRNFDEPCTITPTIPNRAFWGNALTVALDDLADLVAPARVVLCEGRPLSQANAAKAEFDASCYRRIFADEFPDTDFISVGNSADVQTDRLEVGKTINALVSGTQVIRVIDRDDRSSAEISQLQAAGIKVLTQRHLEAFLLADEILTALCEQHGQTEKVADLLEAKKKAIADSTTRGNALDDVKSASGTIYNETKRLLGLTGCGNTSEAFCRDTMAPLVTPSTTTYRELRHAIFGS
jgi:predicted ATPase